MIFSACKLTIRISFLSISPETSSRQHNLHLFLNPAKGSRFTLGVWGLRRVRWAFNRSQVSASDRRESNMTVPVASSAKAIAFGGFKRRVASFRVAGVALCDISTSTCFITCCFFCGRFASFSEDELTGATLWRSSSSFCVAGAALQTFRFACFL